MSLPLGLPADLRRRAVAVAALGAAVTALALWADPWLLAALDSLRTAGGRRAMLVLTHLGDGAVDFALAAAVAAAGWALGRSRWVDAGARGIGALAAAGIAVQVIKHLACRARPAAAAAGTFFQGAPCLGGEPAVFSFPSGHATTATALGVVLALRVPGLRLPAAATVVVVMVSRVYLGAHFPSDVLAGATLGAVAGMVAAGWPLRREAGAPGEGPLGPGGSAAPP